MNCKQLRNAYNMLEQMNDVGIFWCSILLLKLWNASPIYTTWTQAHIHNMKQAQSLNMKPQKVWLRLWDMKIREWNGKIMKMWLESEPQLARSEPLLQASTKVTETSLTKDATSNHTAFTPFFFVMKCSWEKYPRLVNAPLL